MEIQSQHQNTALHIKNRSTTRNHSRSFRQHFITLQVKHLCAVTIYPAATRKKTPVYWCSLESLNWNIKQAICSQIRFVR